MVPLHEKSPATRPHHFKLQAVQVSIAQQGIQENTSNPHDFKNKQHEQISILILHILHIYRSGHYKIIWDYPGLTKTIGRPWERCLDENMYLPECEYLTLHGDVQASELVFNGTEYTRSMSNDYHIWIAEGKRNQIALYNIHDDPSESVDLSEHMPEKVRQHSLYSLVHESRQGFFSHVRGKKV